MFHSESASHTRQFYPCARGGTNADPSLSGGRPPPTQTTGRIGARLPGEQIRFLLALLILSVAAGLCYTLVATPDDLFSLQPLLGSR